MSFLQRYSVQKQAETGFTLGAMDMGARTYIPLLGRFLQMDPVQGGTPNNYVYPTDPVNGNDLTGLLYSNVSGGFSLLIGGSISYVEDDHGGRYLVVGASVGSPGPSLSLTHGPGRGSRGFSYSAQGCFFVCVGGSKGAGKRGSYGAEGGIGYRGWSVGLQYSIKLRSVKYRKQRQYSPPKHVYFVKR